MKGANWTATPYKVSADLSRRKENEENMPLKPYQSAVGTLRFICDTTLPGIAYIVGILGRNLHDPAQRHMDALKHVYRYLSSRANQGLTYTKVGPLHLTGYTDSYYAADLGTRRSLSGLIVFDSGQPIIWASVGQLTVTHSSTKAEYISADTGTKTMTWLENLADKLKSPLKTKTELRIDNKPETKYHEGNIVSDTNNILCIRYNITLVVLSFWFVFDSKLII